MLRARLRRCDLRSCAGGVVRGAGAPLRVLLHVVPVLLRVPRLGCNAELAREIQSELRRSTACPLRLTSILLLVDERTRREKRRRGEEEKIGEGRRGPTWRPAEPQISTSRFSSTIAAAESACLCSFVDAKLPHILLKDLRRRTERSSSPPESRESRESSFPVAPLCLSHPRHRRGPG